MRSASARSRHRSGDIAAAARCQKSDVGPVRKALIYLPALDGRARLFAFDDEAQRYRIGRTRLRAYLLGRGSNRDGL
jgi:hypothetical protein